MRPSSLFAVCALAVCAAGQDDGDNHAKAGYKNVVQLDKNNFDTTVMESDEFWMVKFWAPWCGHCVNLAPEWEKAAAKMADWTANFGAVDCTAPDSKDVCQRYGVHGYPNVKAFGRNKKSPITYEGARETEHIVYFVSQAPAFKPVAHSHS
jgi:protein disulfide-isomerase A6